MTAGKRRAVVVSLAAAALALVPVPLGWDDGCNRHGGGRYPLVEAGFILVLRPESPFVPPPNELYVGAGQTLIACPPRAQ
jgi:hypothetical protein